MKNKYLTLNIQMFADEPTDGGTNEGSNAQPEKTITKEDYDKLASELAKIKQANDNLSKENANYKRQAKDKMSEEEKKAQQDKEKDDLIAQMRQEILSTKMSKELTSCGFDDKQCEEIISCYTKGDMVEFTKTISNKINELVANKIKEEQKKFQASSTLPPNGTGATDKIDPLFKSILDSKETNKKNNARDYYLNNKK